MLNAKFFKDNWKMIVLALLALCVGYYFYSQRSGGAEMFHSGADKGDKAAAAGGSEKGEFVMYYMPWCSHCKKVMPVWNKLNIKDIFIRTINCDEQPDVAEDQNIVSFPTFRYYPNGMADTDNYVPYQGDRTLEDFMKFLGAASQQA